jgi:hypothetical protein
MFHTLQQYQQHHSSNTGELLLGFLKFYGEEFRADIHGISVQGQGCFYELRRQNQHHHAGHSSRYYCESVLTIDSPVAPGTNMAKGAFRASAIFRCFAMAHKLLVGAIGEYNQFDGKAGSPRDARRVSPTGKIACHASAHAQFETQSKWGAKSLLLRRLLKVKWGKQSQRLLREQLRSRMMSHCV